MADVITASTLIGHHRRELTCTGRVLDVRRGEHGHEVVTDRTAFYPQNLRWPDQPADRGVMVTDAGRFDVVGVENRPLSAAGLTGAVGDETTFATAVHVVATDTPPAVGDTVTWEVDAEHRAAVSRQHSAVHLMALALNDVTAGCWTKDAPRRDSLEHPDLDSLAVESSTITPDGGVDVYRFGKSLRKKGFDRTLLPEDPADLATAIAERVRGWVAGGAPVEVEAENDSLDGRRTWRTTLEDGVGAIPCGGSHVTSLTELGDVTIDVTYDESGMTIRTSAHG